LCISEAVVNSIKHGNKNDLNKNVYIEVDCKMPEVDIQIEVI